MRDANSITQFAFNEGSTWVAAKYVSQTWKIGRVRIKADTETPGSVVTASPTRSASAR